MSLKRIFLEKYGIELNDEEAEQAGLSLIRSTLGVTAVEIQKRSLLARPTPPSDVHSSSVLH